MWKKHKECQTKILRKNYRNISYFNYLGYLIFSYDNNIRIKLQRYNKMGVVIKVHFGKRITTETKLRIHNFSSDFVLWQ
jgi:hypothetical protein